MSITILELIVVGVILTMLSEIDREERHNGLRSNN